MNFPKPAKGSLFSILVNAPFWISLLVAGVLFAIARNFLPDLLAAATTLPFIGTAAFAGWRQFNTPSPARINATMDLLRAMPFERFAQLVADGYRRQGYTVGPLEQSVVSYEIQKSGYPSIVSCKRWKVIQTGIGPLRELHDAGQARETRESIYIAAGDFSDSARAFARENNLHLVHGAELVALIGRIK